MSNPLLVRHSLFEVDSLARRIESRWGLRDVSCEYWARAVNDRHLSGHHTPSPPLSTGVSTPMAVPRGDTK